MDDWVIEVEDLTTGYGDTPILEDVTVRIPRRAVTCIIGGSGSGKSTFLRSVIGLLPPWKGRVTVLGHDLYALGEEDRSRLLANVGLMFQDGALLNSINVEENLAIPLVAHTTLPRRVIRDVIRMKLGLVHLEHAARLLPGELSGGMRKRAGLARAIVLDPEVVLCDEPSAGLDPLTAASLDHLLLQLGELLHMTVIVVTHELSSIRSIADRIVMLHQHGVHFDGTLKEAEESGDEELLSFFQRKPRSDEGGGGSLLDRLAPMEAV